MRPFGTQKQLERRRRRALQLLENGLTVSAVALKVGSSHSSVILWRDRYKKEGPDSLKPKPAPGRSPKLNSRQKERLTRILLKGALAWGFSTDLWTQKRVAQVIEKEFGVEYHPNHLWRFLIHLGWSCQKPEKQARERNQANIDHWKRWIWPHIKKSPKVGGLSGLPG